MYLWKYLILFPTKYESSYAILLENMFDSDLGLQFQFADIILLEITKS